MRNGRGQKLHVGCGLNAIAGWINIDSARLPTVDRVLDASRELPFEDASRIFAEHFLEHLSLLEGLAFLRHCRRALAEDGVLRLSTPNLEYVMQIQYPHARMKSDADFEAACVNTNRAFYAWGHRFLYNRQILKKSLEIAGFLHVRFHRYGESDRGDLKNLERHPRSPDSDDYPHVIVAEAWGRQKAKSIPDLYEDFRVDIRATSPPTRIAALLSHARSLARRARKRLRERGTDDRGAPAI